MADRFFTLMLVPEKSDRIRRFTLPTLYLRVLSAAAAVLCLLGIFVFFDYLHVLSQVAENKKLRLENHLLRSDIQNAKTKLESLDQSVTRLRSFANKLRVISNLGNPASQKMLDQIPDLPAGPAGRPGEPNEDNGSIEEPDRHSQLEEQRSRTALGELDQDFASEDLALEVEAIGEAAEKLVEVAKTEEANLAAIQENMQDQVIRLMSTPSIYPTSGYISSEFGYRFNPFSGVKTFHAGIDFANRSGTPIHAPADGLVTHVGSQGGFGLIVRIDHGYGIVSKYGHNSRSSVKAGERVRRGDKIAEMGSSGRSTGPHLHYQIEVNGKAVNPRLFMLEDTF